MNINANVNYSYYITKQHFGIVYLKLSYLGGYDDKKRESYKST